MRMTFAAEIIRVASIIDRFTQLLITMWRALHSPTPDEPHLTGSRPRL
jgi:hypothetical protein